ncbi:MAG: molybdopterin biosynthesis protein [Chloroflexi bacterium]|nr:molybdopterin biosynthesis protein [Chloroflexota bacterium]
MQRKVYLENIPLDDALARFYGALEGEGALQTLPGELVPLDQALGRVTAQPVWARISSPHYHSAAMDGVVVWAEDTYGASKTSPLLLKVGEQARWVDTGDPVPPGFNAVIMVEDVQPMDDDHIQIMAAVAAWQHIRLLGEDIVATELVLPENHRIGPSDLGAMAAAGIAQVEVRRKPLVTIIPTGTELVRPGDPLEAGKIIEYNSLVMAAQVEEWGGHPVRHSIVPDDFQRIKTAVQEALEVSDVVILNAGSSAGSEDYTSQVVSEVGELLVHGIAVRPGHPVVLGVVGNKPIIGVPGYPVSCVLTMDIVTKPLIGRLLGVLPPSRPKLTAVMSRKVLSPMGEDEFLRVKVGKVGDRLIATPLNRGAGVIMSLVRADGLVRIPRFSEGVEAGSNVEVELLRPQEEVENTIVVIGSHDMTLDLLGSMLHKYHPALSLSSSNVGSLGGLQALRRGEAHMAGSHLLDEDTGEYNISYIQRVLEGQEIVLVNLVYREQGMIVPRGNPKAIRSLADLTRKDVSFVNRQRGSGTRVLLDYELSRAGIDPKGIIGYDRDEYTHTGVAAAVASGTADVGLGIMAAAKALALDFVPLLKERYDLVIPRAYYESSLLQPLLDIIRQPGFQAQVVALGGYDTSQTGQVVAELPG